MLQTTVLITFDNLYTREFEKTKADAADPLKAAQVYSNIVKAVNEAEEAAKRAIKAAEDSIRIVGFMFNECGYDLSLSE
jgi:hypothetical protein